jgi:hypothetical protein
MTTINYTIEPGGLGEDHHAKIFALHEKGWSCGRIAQHLRKHPGTVNWFLYSHGLKAPRKMAVSRTYTRGGRTVRTFSAEDDAFMEALRVQDYEIAEIARLISARTGHDYGAHSVHNRLIMLAAIDEEAA